MKKDGSYYYRKGKKYPRVTAVLNVINDTPAGFLVSRYDYDGFREMIRCAGDKGTLFHEITAKIDRGKVKKERDPHMVAVWAQDESIYYRAVEYLKWHKEYVKKVTFGEKTFLNRGEPFGGSIDGIVEMKGEGTQILLEKKTSNKLTLKHYIQVHIYMHLAALDEAIIAHFPKTGKYKMHRVKYDERYISAFYSYLDSFNKTLKLGGLDGKHSN